MTNARRGIRIVGWVSGYVLPHDPETFFVWQVAVSEAARGMGLGTKMLNHLIARDGCDEGWLLQTTITADNEASWALFRKFSDYTDGELSSTPYFSKAQHFNDAHDTEYMVTITMKARTKKAA